MNKELAKNIGTAARQARKALQLTQEDAAERIDVSVEFYARIERGTSLPSILTFARVVAALGVSADALLGRHIPVVTISNSWTAPAPVDGPEIRRVVRRLRKADSGTLRLVNLLLKELESKPASNQQELVEAREPTQQELPLAAAESEKLVVSEPAAEPAAKSAADVIAAVG